MHISNWVGTYVHNIRSLCKQDTIGSKKKQQNKILIKIKIKNSINILIKVKIEDAIKDKIKINLNKLKFKIINQKYEEKKWD